MPLRLVSWNIHQLDEPWRQLATDPALDVALLQEAKPPPADVKYEVVPARGANWKMPRYRRAFRTAVVRLSDHVSMNERRVTALALSTELTADEPAETHSLDIGVSVPGTLTVVDVTWGKEVFTCISAYAVWQNFVSAAKKPGIMADGSAHRIISDLSTLITSKERHRIIVAGDWNLLYGYGENGNAYWAGRYATVFDRMKSLGLRFVGPQTPNGRAAEPWPAELPKDSLNVPTFFHAKQKPATATRQLDYVFASESIADRLRVRAMNEVADWGPSDHCRVVIEVVDR
jgi:exonuclease III